MTDENWEEISYEELCELDKECGIDLLYDETDYADGITRNLR